MATQPKKNSPFTVDAKTNSSLVPVPSITKLLNRKKLGIPSSETSNPPPLGRPATPPEAPRSIPPIKMTERELTAEEDRATRTEIVFAPPEIADDLPSIEMITQVTEQAPTHSEPSILQDPSVIAIEAPSLSNLGLSLSEGLPDFTPPVAPEAIHEPIPSLPDSSGMLEMPQFETPLTAPALEPMPPSLTKTALARPAKIRQADQSPLHFWDPKTLKGNHDPLAKGILVLMNLGASSVLYMALISPPPGTPVPHFIGSAMAGEASKEMIWTGLKWDPVVVPSVWNYFVRSGYVELAPPGTKTDQMSQRNVMRGALGLLPDEILLLLRIGPENACRGALAIVSKQSLVGRLDEALKFLNLPAPKAA